MNGYQLTFFTVQQRVKGGKFLADWLLDTARALGVRGATVVDGVKGLGHDGGVHRQTLFDQADQPVQITMVVTPEEADLFFAALGALETPVFYLKAPVEFGFVGKGA